MFEKLIGLVGDNQSLKDEITAIQSKITTDNETSKATIESLTTQFNDAKSSRDAYKKGNQLVKKALGIDSIDEVGVREKIESLSSNKDSAKQIQDLTDALSSKDDEIKTQAEGFTLKMNDFRVNDSLSKGIDSVSETLVDDPLIRDAFKGHILKNVGLVGDVVSPFTMVGDQRVPVIVDGKPQSVEDYTKSVLLGDSFASFRKTQVGSSAGSTGGGKSNGGDERYFDKTSPDFSLTKQGEIFKRNPEQYNQLSKG